MDKMAEFNEKKLKTLIIEVYERYISGKNIRKEAQDLFLEYNGAEMFLSEEMNDAIGYLETIGWDLNPNQKIAKKILENLKK
jgi:hypothetical protein